MPNSKPDIYWMLSKLQKQVNSLNIEIAKLKFFKVMHLRGHNRELVRPVVTDHLCECGCGKLVTTTKQSLIQLGYEGKIPRFIAGHNNTGKKIRYKRRNHRTPQNGTHA